MTVLSCASPSPSHESPADKVGARPPPRALALPAQAVLSCDPVSPNLVPRWPRGRWGAGCFGFRACRTVSVLADPSACVLPHSLRTCHLSERRGGVGALPWASPTSGPGHACLQVGQGPAASLASRFLPSEGCSHWISEQLALSLVSWRPGTNPKYQAPAGVLPASPESRAG